MNILSRPKYIIDVGTKNISFLQTSKDLKTLGVKNCYFFLKLYDPSLRGIDPHSPLLTEDLIMRILNECLINPWYFIREVARIPDEGGSGVTFRLDRGNLADIWCVLKGFPFYTVRPRQTGKTQSLLAIFNWAFLFGTTNSEFMFNNKDQDAANMNLERLKKQRDLLPKYMQFKIAVLEDGKVTEGTDNVKSLENANNKNKIVTNPRALSKEKAELIGRGCTQPMHFFDEAEFTNHIKTIVQTSGPAYRSASASARRNNAIHCRVFASTPGDLDSAPCQEAVEIIEGCCKWTESFYDWSDDDIESYMEKGSRDGIIYIEYSYQQLGLDEVWFREVCKTVLNDKLMIKREIFLKRIRGSSNSPFDQEDLEAIADEQGSVIEEIFINKFFKLEIYSSIQKNQIYIVSVDCGTGTGNDNTAVTVMDPYTELPVAEFKSPYIGVTEAVKFLVTLVKKYIPRAILCIERNHVGIAIIDGVKDAGLISNLYFDNTKTFNNVDDKLDGQGFLKEQAFNRRLFGVWTGTASRDIMMNILATRVKEMKDKFICANIINDIMHLVKTKKGKIEAGPGFNDDCIMSYLIGQYVLYYGNNLHRYGFVKEIVPEHLRNKGLLQAAEEEWDEYVNKDHFSKEYVKGGTQDDYSRKVAEEMYKASTEVTLLDKITFNSGSYKNIEESSEWDQQIPFSFFDELNK